jgi:predicted metal-dependent phosphoesterase TrpH
VLAHPYSLHNDELIPKFADYGIMGLEVYYPEHSQSMINLYLRFAQKHNLLVTGGSDCHGSAKPEVRIGAVKIPYELVEQLKGAKGKLR